MSMRKALGFYFPEILRLRVQGIVFGAGLFGLDLCVCFYSLHSGVGLRGRRAFGSQYRVKRT